MCKIKMFGISNTKAKKQGEMEVYYCKILTLPMK